MPNELPHLPERHIAFNAISNILEANSMDRILDIKSYPPQRPKVL